MEKRKDYRETLYAARRVARTFGYVKTIAAEIYGKILYLTEGEVRALQIMAEEKAEESDEAFNEFCENVIVYSNVKKKISKHKMKFQKDGSFENDFENGFFSACALMAIKIP